jgi:hypothetical protein
MQQDRKWTALDRKWCCFGPSEQPSAVEALNPSSRISGQRARSPGKTELTFLLLLCWFRAFAEASGGGATPELPPPKHRENPIIENHLSGLEESLLSLHTQFRLLA